MLSLVFTLLLVSYGLVGVVDEGSIGFVGMISGVVICKEVLFEVLEGVIKELVRGGVYLLMLISAAIMVAQQFS